MLLLWEGVTAVQVKRPWLCTSFPGGSDGKESACNAGDPGSTPGSGRSPGEGNGNPSGVLAWKIPWTEESVGYSPWGHKELDTTERLHFHSSLSISIKVRNKTNTLAHTTTH